MKEECHKNKLKFIEMLFTPGSFNNDFAGLLNNYIYFQKNGVNYNTGILKTKHLSHVLNKYSFIDWQSLCAVRLEVHDNKIKYLLRMIELYYRNSRIRNELPFDEENNFKLAYISSNLNLLNETVTLNPGTQFSYAIPAIYTSGYVNGFSECTKDLFWDRLSMGIFYNIGISIKINNDINDNNFFYVDRKINVPYIKSFITKVVEDFNLPILNLDEKIVSSLSNEIKIFLTEIDNESTKREIFQRVIDLSNKMEFSFIGYLLFEIIHEYIVEKNIDIFTANQILRIISPNQFVLWSMRSFNVTNLRELILKLKVVVPIFKEEEFISFVVNEFLNRVYLVVGEDFEFLQDAVYVSLFSKKVHQIENKDISLKSDNNYLSIEIFNNIVNLNELTDYCGDTSEEMIQIYSLKLQPSEIDKFILKQSQEISNDLKIFINEYFIKLAYQKIKKDMKVEMVDVFSKNDVGVVMANLQPDDRGEFLLVSCNSKSNKFQICSFEINRDLEISNTSNEKVLLFETDII